MLHPLAGAAGQGGAEHLQLLHLRVPRTARLEFGRGKDALLVQFVLISKEKTMYKSLF